MGLRSREIWLPGSLVEPEPRQHWAGHAELAAVATGCAGGFGGRSSKLMKPFVKGSSLSLPCSPMAAKFQLPSVEWKEEYRPAEEAQDPVSPPVCTPQTSFEHEVLFGHFTYWF